MITFFCPGKSGQNKNDNKMPRDPETSIYKMITKSKRSNDNDTQRNI